MDTLNLFCYLLILFLTLSIIGGFMITLFLKIASYVAIFVYAGLLFIENALPIKLYLPENGKYRISMDVCSMIFFALLLNIIEFLTRHFKNLNPPTSIEKFPNITPLALMAFVFLIATYLIGYTAHKKSKIDEDKDTLERFADLKFPSFPKLPKLF